MTFEGHFSCRNHLSTNTSVTYYAPDLRGGGIKRWWPSSVCLSVRLSVCLSVSCLDLSRELKGPGSPYLAPWKPMTRVTHEPVSKSKGQRSRSPGRLQLTHYMRRIFRTRRPTNFKLDLRKSPYSSFYLEQPSATNENTQQHEASRGLSVIAELLVESVLMLWKENYQNWSMLVEATAWRVGAFFWDSVYNFSIAICHLFSLASTSVIICVFLSYNLLFPWPNMLTSVAHYAGCDVWNWNVKKACWTASAKLLVTERA